VIGRPDAPSFTTEESMADQDKARWARLVGD
jgi:hypothetical protein